jgi:hypothetical protein
MKKTHIIQLAFTFFISFLNAQINITRPTLDLGTCILPSNYFTLGNIVLAESQNSDFSAGNSRTIIISAPSGLEFQTTSGTISVISGRNISNEQLTITSNTLTIVFNCNGTNKLDIITLMGLKLRAISIGNYTLTRNGGNATINGLPVGSNLTGLINFVSLSANQYRTNPTISGFLDWNLPSTWECNAVPPNDGSAIVTIRAYQNGSFNSGNSVFFNGNPIIKSLSIENNANFSSPKGNGKTLIVKENFTIQSGGSLRQINWSQSGANSLNIGGNFTNNGFMISASGSGGNGIRIVMDGLVPQIISGTGNFRMIGNGQAAGSLVITNPTGVELQANFLTDNGNGNSGAVIVDGLLTFLNPSIQFTGIGNLQLNGKTILKAGTFNQHYAMTGTRTIGNASTIEYTNPASTISAATIPSLNLNNLILNNTLPGILSVQNQLVVGGTLSMLGGTILNGTNTIQVGTSTSNKGLINYASGLLVGKLKRWFAGTNVGNQSGLFPIGNASDYKERFVKIEYTQATTGGSITAEWTNLPMGNNVTNESVLTNCDGTFSISNTASGYWTMTPADGITNAENKTYNITLSANNLPDFSNDCHITALKRDINNIWTYSGVHLDNTGTAMNPTITRLNAKGWSNWGLGGEGDPLPVELLSMNLTCSENEVVFSWSTASEYNSESFLLEKSGNCIEWIETNEIQAAGFSTDQINYELSDNRIAGMNYYRLSQQDFDGKKTIYDPLVLTCQDESPFKILVWPNPEETGFHLFINDAALVGESTLSLRNYAGEIVFKQNITCESGSTIFDFPKLNITPGIYFIQVSNECYFSKVIKHLVR